MGNACGTAWRPGRLFPHPFGHCERSSPSRGAILADPFHPPIRIPPPAAGPSPMLSSEDLHVGLEGDRAGRTLDWDPQSATTLRSGPSVVERPSSERVD